MVDKMITKIDENTLKVNDVDKLIETLDELRPTAKEMFKVLGYELNTDKEDVKTYINGWQTIEFININEPKVYAEYEITLDELTAINKQIEELGW